MDRTPIVQIRSLTKTIGNKTIVDSLTFDVFKGEVFGFLGPNGAGKTTTIRMIVGLISMTKGQVLINGADVASNFEAALRHVGAIVENPELYKFMSGYKNLLHFARMTPGVTRQRIDEVVKLVGLENRIQEKVKTYSLGMRQRLGLAQALLHKPSVLILDEPTNGLDPAGIRELRDHLRKLAETEGIAVIVSSHLLSEMELMCDRVAIIQNGKLVQVKSLKEMMVVDQPDKQFAVQFDVDSVSDAQRVLSAHLPHAQITLHAEYLALTLSREQIAEVNALLVQNGFKVYGIRAAHNTLEDRFLELTGSGPLV